MTAFTDAVIATSPTAWWRHNDASGNLSDSSGNARTVTAGGSGLSYSQAGLDGSTSILYAGAGYFTLADASWMNPNLADFSLMFGLKRSGAWPSGEEQIIGHDGQGYDGTWFARLRGGTADDISVGIQDFTSGTEYIANLSSGVGLSDAAIHLCFVTWDRNGNAVLYVDSNTPQESIDVSSTSAYVIDRARSLFIGARDTTPTYALNATLCELGWWNGTLLSTTQIGDIVAALTTTQRLNPDADVTTTGWTTTPLWSKIDEDPASPDGTVISATAS
jgi:hypothetical protein